MEMNADQIKRLENAIDANVLTFCGQLKKMNCVTDVCYCSNAYLERVRELQLSVKVFELNLIIDESTAKAMNERLDFAFSAILAIIQSTVKITENN